MNRTCYVILVVLAVHSASAQAAPPNLYDMSLSELLKLKVDDPVVSAQKYLNNAQNVPISLEVISRDDMQTPLLQNLLDLDHRSAKLTTTSYSGATPQLFIRGIGSNSSGASDEPSVSVLVDDIPLASAAFHDNFLLDQQRVEILAGPQSSLYGSTTIGGAVHLLPVTPDNRFSSNMAFSVGEKDQRQFSGYRNDPLNARLNNRLAVYWRGVDGDVENHISGNDLQHETEFGVREQLQWQGEQENNLRLMFDYQRKDFSGPPYTYDGAPVSALFGGTALVPYQNRNSNTTLPYDGFSDIDRLVASLHYHQPTAIGELTSITGYVNGSVDFANELYPVAVNTVFAGNSAAQDTDQWSQELRLSNRSNDSIWESMFGLFVMQTDTSRDERFDFSGVQSLVGFGGLITPETPGYVDWSAKNKTTTRALFGEITWHPQSRWDITTGIRLDKVRKVYDLVAVGGDPLNLSIDNSADYIAAAEQDWTETSWRLVSAYDVLDTLSVYASYNTGFKPGSFDQLAPNAQRAENGTASEIAETYELGLKGSDAEQRIQYTLAVFTTDYDNLQIFATYDAQLAAPAATINGVEAGVSTVLYQGLTLSASYAWLDTEYDRLVTPGGVDVSGNELIRAPQIRWLQRWPMSGRIVKVHAGGLT